MSHPPPPANMRFVEKEIAGQEHIRYLFALGKAEATILLKLIDKALLFMPKTVTTQSTEARLTNMRRAIRDAIPRIKTKTKDDYSFLND